MDNCVGILRLGPMSKGGGNSDGGRSGARGRGGDGVPSSQNLEQKLESDLELGGRDYRRARELLWMAAHDLSAPLAAIRMQARAKERQHRRQPLTGDEW